MDFAFLENGKLGEFIMILIISIIQLFCDYSSSPMLSSCRVEQTTAVNWVRSHMEESTDTSLPKQEVYEEYR